MNMIQHKKVALITGANRGIGFEIARQLGELGMIVLMGARNVRQGDEAASKLRSENIEAHVVHLDVTDQSTIDATARFIAETYARLDVLVNNAGIVSPDRNSLAALRTTYETNVFGVFAMTQAMIPLLHKSEGGRIVNVSSGLGSLKMVSDVSPEFLAPLSPAYGSSKTAVNSLTVFWAKELHHTGIKVNATDPGMTATDMNPQATRSPHQGAKSAVWLATLPVDGPTGGFFNDEGPLPW